MHMPFCPSLWFSIKISFHFYSFNKSGPSDIASLIFTNLVSIMLNVSNLAWLL